MSPAGHFPSSVKEILAEDDGEDFMKYGFYFLLGTMIVSFLGSILTNCFSKIHSNAQKGIAQFSTPLLSDASIHNAMIINQSSPSESCPARPIGESYSDGIIEEVKNQHSNLMLPENTLVNIRDMVSQSLEN